MAENLLEELNREARKLDEKEYHLKNLIQDPERFNRFSLSCENFFYDYSKQRVDDRVLALLIELAKKTGARDKFSGMASGDIVNTSEKKAALHTGARNFEQKIFVDDIDFSSKIRAVNEKISEFSLKIHSGRLRGSTEKSFTDAVVIGMGGSYLGCKFVYNALKQNFPPLVNLCFLSTVDIDGFAGIIKKIDPETTLWIVISKSYRTPETMANLKQAMIFLKNHKLDPRKHLVSVTAEGSPGDSPSNPVSEIFYISDFIGGRYSVTSAPGGLPLSLAFGFDVFERFLKGCRKMDLHALNRPEEENIPLVSALISIWNSNFLNYPAQAIVPYSSLLEKLVPHVQHVYMESLGKMAPADRQLMKKTGIIIFGEPGTNAQHSFFQMAYQGITRFSIEFIGIVKPFYRGENAESKGVYNHQELWANMIAQATALATGKDNENSAKYFPGNSPSSTLIVNSLSPENIGILLSFYEARTVFEGFILGINPFDQFGVELGKVLASDIRDHIRAKNDNGNHGFQLLDKSTRFYLETLFKGSL